MSLAPARGPVALRAVACALVLAAWTLSAAQAREARPPVDDDLASQPVQAVATDRDLPAPDSLAVATHPVPPRGPDQPGFRGWLRRKVERPSDAQRYGLRPLPGNAPLDPTLPLVVLVHGFNSHPERNAAVLGPALAAGFECWGFAYPNDQPLAASAELLAHELRDLRSRQPDRKVALVTHSMGGLVARECLENPRLDPGNVRRLIMIAPPSHGTLLARAAVGTDVWEHWISRRDGGPWKRVRDSVVDGLGEAAKDLEPESEFLQALNARQRHPEVQYTLLLGADASLDEGEIAWIRQAVRGTGGRLPGVKQSANRLDAFLADFDEIVDGKGDGVVAIKRAKLSGVDDVVILPVGHLAATGPPKTDAVKQMQQEVLSRLQAI